MSPRKSDQILSEWLAVADSAPRPARAPRGNGMRQRTRSGLPAGMAATLLAVVVIAVVIGVRLASSPGSVGASQSAAKRERLEPGDGPVRGDVARAFAGA